MFLAWLCIKIVPLVQVHCIIGSQELKIDFKSENWCVTGPARPLPNFFKSWLQRQKRPTQGFAWFNIGKYREDFKNLVFNYTFSMEVQLESFQFIPLGLLITLPRVSLDIGKNSKLFLSLTTRLGAYIICLKLWLEWCPLLIQLK